MLSKYELTRHQTCDYAEVFAAMDQAQVDYLKRKKEAFDVTDSPDEDDERPDPGRDASKARWMKTAPQATPVAQPPAPSTARSLTRSKSDMSTVNRRPQQSEDPFAIASSSDPRRRLPNRPTVPSGLKKSVSDFPRPAPAAAPCASKVIGKRKREVASTSAQVNEEPKLFTGLHFYFFPNNDAHPARRMRIAKSVEHGATWVKTWDHDAITHVILDNSMTLSQLLKFLKLETLPSSVTIVSESYPAECISYRTLLDPTSPAFTVNGFQPPQLTKPDSTESDTSLQLKPTGKSETVRRQQSTPPPADRGISLNTHPPAPDQALDDRPEAADRVADSFVNTQIEVSEELDKAIEQAKALEHVPLDDEEGQGHSDDGQKESLRLLAKRKNKVRNIEDKFQCMQKHTGEKSDNPNLQTINILQAMADYYGQMGDEWRIRAYRRAILTLRNHPHKVWTKEEALALPNIGDRLATNFEEIASTDRLRRLDEARAEPSDQVLQTFMKVYGAGIVQATKWVDEGYSSLDELIQKAILTDNQRIGIEHFEDFNSRIPREEVQRHGNIVRKMLQKIDPQFEVIIGGSFRRGAKDSGDIDCIVTRPNTNADHLRNVVLGQLVPKLTTSGFLVASLAITSRDDGSKWHGASKLPDSKVWRRLDLLLVPSDEIGAALIYFTGNDIFNRSLRLLASTKGMRLNQRGLYKGVMRGPGRVKLNEGELVEGKDEKKIFAALGVPWRPPEHRIC